MGRRGGTISVHSPVCILFFWGGGGGGYIGLFVLISASGLIIRVDITNFILGFDCFSSVVLSRASDLSTRGLKERERERERESVCVCVCVRACGLRSELQIRASPRGQFGTMNRVGVMLEGALDSRGLRGAVRPPLSQFHREQMPCTFQSGELWKRSVSPCHFTHWRRAWRRGSQPVFSEVESYQLEGLVFIHSSFMELVLTV